jgi:hypothetical protein
MKLTPNVQLLLADWRGVYIPQNFCQGFDLSQWQGIPDWAIDCCRKGPEEEDYWDAWTEILDSAVWTAPDGRVFTLHQDGDLWAVCYDTMSAEEREAFGFEEA